MSTYAEEFKKETGHPNKDAYIVDDLWEYYMHFSEWLIQKLKNKEHAIGLLKEQLKLTEEKLDKAIEYLKNSKDYIENPYHAKKLLKQIGGE